MTQEVWTRCQGRIVYFGFKEIVEDEEHYQVEFSGTSLRVSVRGDGKPEVTYVGEDLGGGHYQLSQVGGEGRALMHYLPGSNSLLGCWDENGESGLLHLVKASSTQLSG